MPGARSVGRGHDDRNASHDERDEGTLGAKPRRGIEAEESEVVVKEVASPDGKGVDDETHVTAHDAQRRDAQPHVVERLFNLIIYGELAEQKPQERQSRHAAHRSDYPSRSGEPVEDGVEAGARLVEEAHEHR